MYGPLYTPALVHELANRVQRDNRTDEQLLALTESELEQLVNDGEDVERRYCEELEKLAQHDLFSRAGLGLFSHRALSMQLLCEDAVWVVYVALPIIHLHINRRDTALSFARWRTRSTMRQ